jgi:hypothetical protein
VANQGRFYDRFDAVVLLSAPADVILERIEARTTNTFGDETGRRCGRSLDRHRSTGRPATRVEA